jgi:outer membrane protein assembly factor BamC
MHKHLHHLFLIASVVSLLGACSMSLEQKKIDYKSAGKAPSLEVPPDLSTVSQDDRFAVPDTNTRGAATYSAYNKERVANPQRDGANLLPELSNVRVDRAGSERWLVVKATPEQVWPVVREFWQENGFLIKIENPETGIMETDWAENRAKIPQDVIRNVLGKVLDSVYSTAERDKFRTRLEPGKDTGTTDIYVSHRGMYEVIKGGDGGTQTVWEPRPADPGLEAEFLRRLMVRFGVEQSRAQDLITTDSTPVRAKLTRLADGVSKLALDDPFDRAWRRVGLALDRVGFTVEDRDRSQGLYYVRYIDPEIDGEKKEQKGWFSKLAFWRGSGKKISTEQYQVKVAEVGEVSQISLLTKDGAADKSETANKILNLLYEQLK